MEIKSRISIIILFTLSVWYAGCTKHANGIPGMAGPAGTPGVNGANTTKASAITGFINLFDQYGVADSSSAGIVLSTLKGDSLISATTDSSGKFSLPPLPPGNYDIHIKKNGFDSLKTFVQHSGGDEPKFIGALRMDASLNTKITGETLSMGTDGFNDKLLIVTLTFSGPPANGITPRYFNFYFSRSGNISSSRYDVLGQANDAKTGNNQYQLQYALVNITNAGFHYSAGDTVYIKTIVAPPPNILTTWFDYAIYQAVTYPYLGDSTIYHFVWPN